MTESRNIQASRRAILGDPSAPLTAEKLRQLVSYNPESGQLRWKFKGIRERKGRIVGVVNRRNGYREASINGQRYRVHRLVWLYVTGRWPDKMIDHIDGDGNNNRLANLREADKAQNGWNTGANKKNKTGFKGVSLCSRTNSFQAHIRSHKRFALGLFDTAEAAAHAYDEAARRLHGEFAFQNFPAAPC